MATSRYPQSDLRRQVGSPKPKMRGESTRTPISSPALARYRNADPMSIGSENKDTECRNILIYGHCRFQNSGCAFNHDNNRPNSAQSSPRGQSNQSDFTKKALNVDSPSFTPAGPPTASSSSTITPGALTKKSTFSSQAASAAVFTPRGVGSATPSAQEGEPSSVFNPATFREFTPQNFELSTGVRDPVPRPAPTGRLIVTKINSNGAASEAGLSFDPFTMPTVAQTLPATPYNPYADDPTGLTGSSAFFQHPNAFNAPLQPLQYHLYAPVGPYRDDLLPFQRQIHDFFMSDKLREDMQRKSEALQQVMPNSTLPHLDNYFSLVPLDTSHRKSSSVFGYTTWVYKATSSKNGKTYCLRRLEGFRLTNEQAIRSVKEWRRLTNGNVVTIHDAFTTRAFGDSSLFFVQDYHPLSKTLAEVHFNQAGTAHGSRFNAKTPITENVLWGYVSQIANALKAVHALSLAARCLDMSKIILTDKGRIRLSACSILDVVHFEARRPIQELQQEDLIQFGKIILSLATNTPPVQLTNLKGSVEQMSRTYSKEMTDTVLWLLTPAPQGATPKGIEEFVRGIAVHMVATLDASLHEADTLRSELYRELENGRLVRLMAKLGAVNERQEFDGDRAWSENGERYMLKLFRDYVFHQVDSNGNPVADMGHIIRCLNRLDAGSDDRICLTSRDEQTSFVVSYKELKKQLGNAFGELLKAGKQPASRGFQGSSH